MRRKTMDLQRDGAALSIARISKIVAYVYGRYQLDPPKHGTPYDAQLRFLSFAEDCTELCPSLYFRLKG